MASRQPRQRTLSIRAELTLGFGGVLAMTVMILVGSYINMHRMHAQVTAFAQESSQVRDLSLLVESDFLAARQGEAEFLSNWRLLGIGEEAMSQVEESYDSLAQAREHLNMLEDLVRDTTDPELQSLGGDLDRLRSLLDSYEKALRDTVSLVQERSRPAGPESALRGQWEQLQATAELLPDQEFVRLVWQLRINEEAFFHTGRQEYVDEVRILVNRFLALVEESPPEDLVVDGQPVSRSGLISAVQNYHRIFQELVNLERGIETNAGISTDVTEDIRAVTVHIMEVSKRSADASLEWLRAIHRQNVVAMWLIGIVVMIIGAIVGVWANTRLVQPLTRLNEAAQRVGMGDLTQKVPVYGGDELAMLARAFNTMTDRLQETLSSLEQQVARRTAELERRTEQLQAAAEITRDAATARNLNELLDRVVELVQARFGFYHVAAFLVSEDRQSVNLMSAAGASAEQLLARGVYIRMGVGVVGHVAETGRPYIVGDTAADDRYIPHAFLPDTRSEAALPLRVGEEVIGVLVVQSDRPHVFGAGSVLVLQTMSDQLAVVIQNVRLVQDMEQALRELEVTSGRYTQESWQEFLLRSSRPTGYRYRRPRLEVITKQHEEALEALASGRTVITSAETVVELGKGEARGSALAVPIKLRDQVIGVLDIHFEGDAPPEAVSLVEEAASRMALALESARLFEEAQARAAREQTIRRITEQIRRAVEVESILQTTITSLGEAVGAPRIYVRLGTEEELLTRSDEGEENATGDPR